MVNEFPRATTLLSVAAALLAPAQSAQEPHAAPGNSQHDAPPPNIVLIYTDDQGYADIGVYGAQGIRTPNLDRLASEGLRLDSFYVSQATCTSSRASIRTGCYANRIGVVGALGPNSKIGLHDDEETLAELLRERGYATSFVGKWHLGHQAPFLPTRHGYDEWFGLPYSNDMWPVDYDGKPVRAGEHKSQFPALCLMDGDEVVQTIDDLEDQASLTRLYTDRALRFIEREAGQRPFFLELAHSMPHVPLGASKAFRGTSEYGPYGDVIAEIDATMGEILAALERADVRDNTFVIFTSDNGPWLNYGDHAGSALPLREGKGTMWEGGCRVPCIMRFPRVIPAGTKSSAIAATIDLLPTILEACNARSPKLAGDGISLLSFLRAPDSASPRDVYYFYYLNELGAVREGRWKLHVPHSYRSYERRTPGANGHPGPTTTGRISQALFDLDEDPGEHRDVADLHPEVVEDLLWIAEQARAELGDGKMRGSGQREAGKIKTSDPQQESGQEKTSDHQ